MQVETKEPVLKTRLMKRSESYSQLTETLQKGVSKKEFDTMRKDLKVPNLNLMTSIFFY